MVRVGLTPAPLFNSKTEPGRPTSPRDGWAHLMPNGVQDPFWGSRRARNKGPWNTSFLRLGCSRKNNPHMLTNFLVSKAKIPPIVVATYY